MQEEEEPVKKFPIQCIPLENLIFAADIKNKLDLLILDMSSTDLVVLSNLRMENIPDIEVVYIFTELYIL